MRPDESIDIEDRNPLFNADEMFSYPIRVPFEGNRQVTRSLGGHQSAIRPVDIEHSPMRVLIDGLPMRAGTAVVSEGEALEGGLSVSMERAERSFTDLIADLECRDIPLADEIKIGEKLGEVVIALNYETHVKIDIKNASDHHDYLRNKEPLVRRFTPQALGFSQPYEMLSANPTYTVRTYHDGEVYVPDGAYCGRSFINVSEPYEYGTRKHPYCNARVAYKHYAKGEDGRTADYNVERSDSAMQYEDIFPYWVLDANRPQSGICFYVMYFLECLFRHLGVQYDLSAIAYGDFLRLCFYTTRCKYTERVNTSRPRLTSKDAINTWLKNYGCGGQIDVRDPESKEIDVYRYYNGIRPEYGGGWTTYRRGDNCRGITVSTSIKSWDAYAMINDMYATSDNFPEMSVQSVLDSLENQFGIKFFFDYQRNKVTAYLLRDVFRSQEQPVVVPCTIDSIVPISEKITGVRCGYSEESDSREQRNNVRHGVKDYDTAYNYIDYREGRVIVGKDLYKEIFRKQSCTDENVYIDITTGNKYRVKIDSAYTSNADMHPVLFEVGQWKGVEAGDCSERNEDFVKEMLSEFKPLPLNDINYYNELEAMNSSVEVVNGDGETVTVNMQRGDAKPILCAFMDEDMEHEFIEQRINSLLDTGSSLTDVYATQVLTLIESYDPSKTDDGNSPLQSYDWGNSIAIMRGGGNNAGVETFDYDFDAFGNSHWAQTVGQYALSTDLVDQFGNVYDYNGTMTGLALDGAFSLKPRSWVQPDVEVTDYYSGQKYKPNAPLVQSDAAAGHSGDVVRYRSRGYVDMFLAELIYFYLHRKYFRIRVNIKAAALADIPNHWRERFDVGGMVGFIDKVGYSASQERGIDYADIYMFVI